MESRHWLAASYLDCQVFQELQESLQDHHHQVDHAGLLEPPVPSQGLL